jgi:hypothetical protein
MGHNVKKISHPDFSIRSVGYKYFVLSDQHTTTLIFKTWTISVYFCNIKYCYSYEQTTLPQSLDVSGEELIFLA